MIDKSCRSGCRWAQWAGGSRSRTGYTSVILSWFRPHHMGRRSVPSLALLLLGGLALHCGASSEGVGEDGFSTGSTLDPDEKSLDLGSYGGQSSSVGSWLAPECGAEGSCIPDEGTCGDGSGGFPGQGGYGGQGGAAISVTWGGSSNFPSGSESALPSCQVSVTCEGKSCEAARVCAPSGTSERGAPCFFSSDCAKGLACVGKGSSGSCQPYCCSGVDASCDQDEFCSRQPLIEVEHYEVPVCMKAEQCSLRDPYPCPSGQSCTCSGDLACIVVRSDGTTACAVPGTGKAGAKCTADGPSECAYGYVCSPVVGCLKLCLIDDPTGTRSCDSGSVCLAPSEASSGFPDDFGVCISGTGDSPPAAK